MAKIDTSTIEGFDGMSAEQKLAAVLGLDIPDKMDQSKFVSKELFDKKAAEAAEANRKLREKMTDDEKAQAVKEAAEAAAKAQIEDLQKRLDEVTKKSTIADYVAKYIAQGYEEALAKSTAEAIVNNDMETVFKNQETYKAALEAKIKADLMKNDPKPGGGSGDDNNPAINQAKLIGKAKAEANKAAQDAINAYL